MTKSGYGMTASPEMNRYLHAHFRDLGRTTSVSCKHAVAFRGKIRRTALDGVLYLRPQTSSCGICLIKKNTEMFLSLTVTPITFMPLIQGPRQRKDCRREEEEEVEEVMVVRLIKKRKKRLQEKRMCGS